MKDLYAENYKALLTKKKGRRSMFMKWMILLLLQYHYPK